VTFISLKIEKQTLTTCTKRLFSCKCEYTLIFNIRTFKAMADHSKPTLTYGSLTIKENQLCTIFYPSLCIKKPVNI